MTEYTVRVRRARGTDPTHYPWIWYAYRPGGIVNPLTYSKLGVGPSKRYAVRAATRWCKEDAAKRAGADPNDFMFKVPV